MVYQYKNRKNHKDSQYKRHFYNDGWMIEFKDDKGKVLYSTEDEQDEGSYRVLHEFNKDKFLVIEKMTSIDESLVYMGFMNAKGKWKEDLWKVDNDLLVNGYKGDELFQLGKGIVGFCMENTGTSMLLVFDSNTDKIFSIPNVWPKNLHYCDGKMVYQIWDASRTYEICVADSEGNVTKLHEEGVNLLDSNEKGFLTDENGISFYDLDGNLQWSFDKYEVSSVWLYGKNVFAKLKGNDGNQYISNIDQKTGKFVYEPIRISNAEITGKYMVDIRNDKDNLKIVNLVNGKSKSSIKLSSKYISKSKVKYCGSGIFVFSTIREKNNVNDCRIFDVKGKEIRPYIGK